MHFTCRHNLEEMRVWKKRAAQVGKKFCTWLKDLMDKDAAEVWATIEPEPEPVPIPEPELPPCHPPVPELHVTVQGRGQGDCGVSGVREVKGRSMIREETVTMRYWQCLCGCEINLTFAPDAKSCLGCGRAVESHRPSYQERLEDGDHLVDP